MEYQSNKRLMITMIRPRTTVRKITMSRPRTTGRKITMTRPRTTVKEITMTWVFSMISELGRIGDGRRGVKRILYREQFFRPPMGSI